MHLPMRAFKASVLASRPGTLVRASASGPASGPEPWQLAKLQQAASQGRRRVDIQRLTKETQLPRPEVLQYLKANAPAEPDTARRQDFDAGRAPEQGGEEEQSGWQQVSTGAAATRRPPAKRSPGSRAGAPGAGPPAWKNFERMKKLGRQAEATLEMVYSRTQWPSDDVIESMWDLHRLKKDKVIDWFQTRRQKDRQGGRGGQARGQDDELEWFDEE